MSTHMDSKVNDKILILLKNMYGTHGKVKNICVTIHYYLGMTFDLSEKGKVKVDMIDYMSAMVDNFSTKFKPDDTEANPTAEDFFAECITDDLDRQQASEYHNLVSKEMFTCKRACPDIGLTITALCTRVKITIIMIGTNYIDCFNTLMEQEMKN